MEFVTFHVGLGVDDAVHPNQTLAHDDYLSMIVMMFASARLFYPDARRVVLTDRRTQFGYSHFHIDQLARSDIDGSQLMLERARAQLRHVRESSFERPLVILDSDILLNGRLDDVFARSFDVAVTWRMSDAQPINGGLVILNNERPEVARAFFERFLRTYEEQYAGQAAWFGDQLALRDCVGLDQDQLAQQDMVEVDGCRVLLLPCDTYNHSPDNGFAAIAQDLRQQRVLHFKGERKRLMQPFWRAWLRPRCSRDPAVQQRAQLERERVAALAAAELAAAGAPEAAP